MCDGALSRQPAFDQMRRSRGLRDTFSAGTASIFGANGDDDTQLRLNDIQPLGAVFTYTVHLATPAGAVQTLRLDHPLNPQEACGKIATIAPGSFARPCL